MAISFHATTICAVRHNGKTAMAGDGQVTMGEKVIEPDDDVLAIGSGGNYALAAAKAMTKYADGMSAAEIAKAAIGIAGDIDIFTNHNIICEEL